jgi:hypothetical protein
MTRIFALPCLQCAEHEIGRQEGDNLSGVPAVRLDSGGCPAPLRPCVAQPVSQKDSLDAKLANSLKPSGPGA